jgi:hexulose-6-phosphate isomerase
MWLKNEAKSNIGFMQGRLSRIRDNRIQSFPWGVWEEEFSRAFDIELYNMEWTIDSDKFSENPLVTLEGNNQINYLSKKFNIVIPSVTCDYFMENPPWKTSLSEVKNNIFLILKGMRSIGSKILVIPLVDNSSLTDSKSYSIAKLFFTDLLPELSKNNLRIAFETDFAPKEFIDFIGEFDRDYFGINYDIGNSASLGFIPTEEFKAYGSRIINVHVKDRVFNGTTVPLGEGDANFLQVFHLLQECNYKGNLILQTARSQEGKDVEVLVKYRNLIEDFWEEATIGQH